MGEVGIWEDEKGQGELRSKRGHPGVFENVKVQGELRKQERVTWVI